MSRDSHLQATAVSPEATVDTSSYRTGVLSLLVLAYTFNFIDRTIIYTIGQAVKEDLSLTDTELGLLGGLAFALFYTVLGIPIARCWFASRRGACRNPRPQLRRQPRVRHR